MDVSTSGNSVVVHTYIGLTLMNSTTHPTYLTVQQAEKLVDDLNNAIDKVENASIS